METKKLTKKQREKFAKIYAMTTIVAIDGTAFEECEMNEDDINLVIDDINRLATKIGKGLPANLFHMEKINKYVREHF